MSTYYEREAGLPADAPRWQRECFRWTGYLALTPDEAWRVITLALENCAEEILAGLKKKSPNAQIVYNASGKAIGFARDGGADQ